MSVDAHSAGQIAPERQAWASWDSNTSHSKDSAEIHNRVEHDAEDALLREEMSTLDDEYMSGPKVQQDGPRYVDGETIDWYKEEASSRAEVQHFQTYRGLRRLVLPLLAASKFWFVIVITGVGVGVVGAFLDILVAWLGDLRVGRCTYGFFYSQSQCCKGYDAGEICLEWKAWSQWFDVPSLGLQSLLQSFIYVFLAVAFASVAAYFVKMHAPYAFHTGIPEIKAILGGYVLDSFLGPWTLLIKAVGLALAVASGLSLGKEGPLVHIACCMAFVASRFFKAFRENEAEKRRILAAAATAGVSVAFGSPLGGVIFGIEELDTYHEDVAWRAFVTSVIAAVTLQYMDPFGTSKLVLFGVTASSEPWKAFELIPWLFLGVMGGLLGALLIRMNVAMAVYRRNGPLYEWPLLEVIGVTAVTAAVSYLVVFLRVPTAELVANLFLECDASKGDYHGLCNLDAISETVFLLLLTAALKIVFTIVTFGMMIPAGIFLPTIAIGACLGRAVGLIVQGIHRAHPGAWLFSACPPDPTVRCISPGFYSVIGATAMLGGVTRMTVSLVVIMFELTGALSHVLPIMIAVMSSKWVADAFGKEGIYASWIAMRDYPWLSGAEYKDSGETAERCMTSIENLVTIDSDDCNLHDLVILARARQFHGYPVVKGKTLIGYVTNQRLYEAIESRRFESPDILQRTRCTFVRKPLFDGVDLSETLEPPSINLRNEVSLELVVLMFQKLNLRYIMFSREGCLTGMVTKKDIVSVMTSQFEQRAALYEDPAEFARGAVWRRKPQNANPHPP
ncbi:Cl-channel protein [Sistotremastrum niveocremeum HHB9708]|uniref:Chloride channel protein n=1 Tax=Sistotremastrum niveocremeum HHB9708 TaxID=1314777 RepID=A0A164VY70_9AGAM|nr:Cl-channel protein [Sistotremastrum niveocremeum HHB9708]